MSFGTRGAWRRAGVAGLLLGLFLAVWLQGCEEGQAPYEVIPRNGDPTDYLPPPPGGVQVGTTHELGLLYHFDRVAYRLLPPIAGTDPHFIRGDSVLVLAGASIEQRLRPDLSDPTLAQVYANPRLFGFVPSTASAAGFFEGPTVPDAHEFFPHQIGDWWEQNHRNGEWMRRDSITAAGFGAPTGTGRTLYRINHHSTARNDLALMYFRPSVFDAVVNFSADPTLGVAYHSWTLIAERVVHPDLRGGPRGEPSQHRNPLFLWPALGTLGTPDPQAPIPATIDQCLDGLPGYLERAALQISGRDFKVGDIYSTWTYLTVDPDSLRHRVATEPPRGRCLPEFVIGTDTLRQFPTYTYSLLCKFEVRCERAVNTYTLLRGADTLGVYRSRSPRPDLGVVKLVIKMSIAAPGGLEAPAQYIELVMVRELGEVVRYTGINPGTRSLSRLRQARVAPHGVYTPADLQFRD